MSRKNQQGKKVDSAPKINRKDSRIKANKVKAQARHAKQVEGDKRKSPKVPRGTARALRRWKSGSTKQENTANFPVQWGKVERLPRPEKVEKRDEPATIMLDGLPMTPQQAAIVCRRKLEEKKQLAHA